MKRGRTRPCDRQFTLEGLLDPPFCLVTGPNCLSDEQIRSFRVLDDPMRPADWQPYADALRAALAEGSAARAAKAVASALGVPRARAYARAVELARE